MIHAKNISFQIPYGESVLHDVSFDLKEGEFLGLLGVNGAGKTALINLILGNTQIDNGELRVLEEDPYQIERSHKHEICYISQNIELGKNLRASFYLELMAGLFPKYSKSMEQKLCKYFDVDISKKIGGLSLGQRKKLQVISALSSFPKLLIVDEVTAVFDEKSRQDFFNVLAEYRKEHQLSVLLATNIAKDLSVYADRVLFLERGKSRLYEDIDISKIFDLEEVA